LRAVSFQRSAFSKKRLDHIQPSPTPEEAAAIVAALGSLHGEREDTTSLRRSRWRLAGLLGREVEPGMKLEGSLWSYSRWEGIA
jgi:hypothetical protein